jgi:hypothetical protein
VEHHEDRGRELWWKALHEFLEAVDATRGCTDHDQVPLDR